MPFAILFSLLGPLLRAAIQVLLPWLIDRITADIQAGRTTTISNDEIKMQLSARKESIRMAYKSGGAD